MMGGNASLEFMLLTPIGEDSIAICRECNYKANMEAAASIVRNDNALPLSDLELVYTPQVKSIDELTNFLQVPIEHTCKAVVYQMDQTEEYVIVFLRGDLDVNETKLTNLLNADIHPANITEDCGLTAGYIGPYQLGEGYQVLFDQSLQNMDYLCCGANRTDHHYKGFQIERDFGKTDYYDLAKIKEGGICPQCGKPAISIVRGIEVGNIFQLGTKYTKAMNMQYVDQEGAYQYPVMGCYGIGIGRLAASVCEVRHDEYGPIWPITIAPWQVHLCCLRSDDFAAKECADTLYQALQDAGIEVIYDDRNVRAGVIFSDADLLGVPIRIIVSPKNLQDDCVEIITRDKAINRKVSISAAIAEVRQLITKLTSDLSVE